MNYTFSKHALDVVSTREIKQEWVFDTIKNHSSFKNISENEVWFFGQVAQKENRCLKVVANPISKIIITAYFDRAMTKKGCK